MTPGGLWACLAETTSPWCVHQLPGPLHPFRLSWAQASVLQGLCKRSALWPLNGGAGVSSNCLLFFWKENSLSPILREEITSVSRTSKTEGKIATSLRTNSHSNWALCVSQAFGEMQARGFLAWPRLARLSDQGGFQAHPGS